MATPQPPRHARRHQVPVGTRGHRKAPPFVVRPKHGAAPAMLPFLAGPVGAMAASAGAVLLALVAVLGAMGVAAVAAFGYFTADLPNFDPNRLPQFETSRIYDRYGNLLEEISDPTAGNRYEVTLAQISPFLVNATVAAEDKTFWTNRGVDAQAIGRAVRNTFIDTSQGASGGSTITMQVIKLAFPERYTRPSTDDKVRQVVAAYALSDRYGKEEVITFYLNNVFYGNRSYGIQAAARNYFQVDAKNLELWQSSILAGLGQAPSRYDPTTNLSRALLRQRYVLEQMVEQGYVTQAQADDATVKAQDPRKYSRFKDAVPAGAPHFINYVHQYIEQNYGPESLYKGGLKVYTTIDMDVQRLAEDVVRAGMQRQAGYDASNGALVAIVPWSGQILCMVGSKDFGDQSKTAEGLSIAGEFNVAVNPRQPGSSIKPIAYAAALEKGWYPSYMILDHHKTWNDGTKEGYTPNNYNQLHNGAVTVREALAMSLNIPALKALEFVGTDANGKYQGPQNFIDFAHRVGIKSGFNRPVQEYGLGISLALGGGEVSPLELTNAYGTFLNGGRYVPASPIIRIETNDGKTFVNPRTGQPVDNSRTVPKGERVMDEANAYMMTSILSDNRARTPIFGASNALILRDRPVAAKSGTTNDFRDGWTVGYSSQMAVGVWVGNNDNHPMREGADGSQVAAPLWNEFMRLMHDFEKAPSLLVDPSGNLPAKEFYRPSTVIDGTSCVGTGKALPQGQMGGEKDVFRLGTPATQKCGELNPVEQRALVEAWEDFTKDPTLIARQSGSPVPAPAPLAPGAKPREWGNYTGMGASRLSQYFNAIDPPFRPKGAGFAPASQRGTAAPVAPPPRSVPVPVAPAPTRAASPQPAAPVPPTAPPAMAPAAQPTRAPAPTQPIAPPTAMPRAAIPAPRPAVSTPGIAR